MTIRRQVFVVLILVFVALTAHAAGRASFDSTPLREFQPARFEQPFRIESDAMSVTLRPVGARTSTARFERDDVAYRGAFRNADVVRGRGTETVVARNRAGLEAVAYEIAETRGVIAAVPFAGGVRFVTGTPANDRMISAPLVVDATGRPSTRAHWEITPADAAGHRTMHLVTDDASLRYPVTIAYRPGFAERPLVSALRPSNPVANGTGSISGMITDAVTSAALSNEIMYVYDSAGNFVTYGLTDETGHYTTADGLDTGTYYAFSWPGNYEPELYNNIPCNGCDVTTGTPISVTNAENTANIDFSVTPTFGRVLGFITSGATPLSDTAVLFYDHNGDAVASGVSDSGGAYEAFVPAAGTPFKARTFNAFYPGLIDILYDNIPCTACDISAGTAINVSAGGTTTGINFNLPVGGSISGSVHEPSGAPLYQASLEIFNSSGTRVATAQSDFDGTYSVANGLPPGNYYVLASAFEHASKLYNNIACNGCNPTTGTAVAVVGGQTTANVNFVLTPNIVPVSGRVYDASTNIGISDVYVLFYDSTGTQVALGISDGSGNYSVTLDGPGTYYARTDNGANTGYLEQLYQNIDCSGCNPTTGTAINAVGGTPISGIDFGLHTNGGSISGTITDRDTNAVIPFGSVAVYNSAGVFVTYGLGDASGNYTTFDGLTAGTYYATGWAPGYGTQLYNGIPCVSGCDVRTGTAITVTAGQTTTGINFALGTPFARITGHVAAASDGSPIANATVVIYDPAGTIVISLTTDASGNYAAQLSDAGTYYAVAGAPGFADQLYDGRACSGCDPTTGDPITATLGATTANINFNLQATACAGMTLEPAALPNGRVSISYSAQLSTSGAVAPVTYAVTTGDLPDGITLNASSGLISGTPTSAGQFAFSIAATDANGCSAARNYFVEIDPTDTVTTTVLTAAPNPATYGDVVTLTATVTPDGATGTVTFKDNGTSIGTGTLDASGMATLLVSFNAGTHPLTATYGGAPTYAGSTSSTVSLVVEKVAPSVNWPTPADIVYGTPLSSTQLNATADVPGTFLYTPAAGTILNAGTQTLTVHFTPDDTANYNSVTSTVPITVLKATPVITWDPGDYTFGTPLGAAQLNATADVAGTFTYNPPAGTILNAGQQTLSAHFTPADTANYNEVDVSVTLNSQKATPLFSNLSAPSIIIGTASTTIGGQLTFGTFIPTGSVSITLNGVTQSAPIGADGSFSSVFATASLVPPSYPIAFSYAGDSNFNPASATSSLSVHYGTAGTKVSNGNGNGGSTIPFRVSVFNASNVNLASSSLQVVAYGVRLVTSSTWLPAQSNGNQGPVFDLQSNGTYMFTLKTTGLAAGNYVFGYRIGNDTTIYTISFTVK